MSQFLIKRFLLAVPTLIVTSAILFILVDLAPGDVMGEYALNPTMSAEIRESIRKSLGLDQPIHIRYIKWASAFLRGDWGYSFNTKQPVANMVFQRIGTTLAIVGVAFVIGSLLAIPIGVLSALKRNTSLDHVITTLSFLGFCLPSFFTGLVLIIIFSVYLGWLPFIYDANLKIVDWKSLVAQFKQSVMPIAVLATYETAYLVRFVRSSTLDVINQEYVRTAYSKGLYNITVIVRHMLRNALIPVVTLVALRLPNVFTGAIITEQIFSVPGIGKLFIRSIETNDIPVVMAITYIYAILVVLFNLIADWLYALLDPRVTYGGR